MRIEEVVRTGLSRIETITTRTAINPLLWLVGLTLPLLLGAAVLIPDRAIRFALIGSAMIPIAYTLVAYSVWMFRDPDRLQSEEFRVRQRALQFLYRKGSSAEIVDLASRETRLETERSKGDKR